MNDIIGSAAFQELLQKRCEEIERSEYNITADKYILKLEKELVELAPENVKKIYFQINYLTHEQQERYKDALIKLR